MRKSPIALTASLAACFALSACVSKPKPAAEGAAPTPPPPAITEQTAPGPSQVQQRSLQEELAATAGDRVYFELDSYSLTDQARATLERQAEWLARHPDLRVLIAGNCDERGTREYNLALGARRASAIRDLLVALGVASNRIDTISYGKERPIAAESSDAAWSRNRNAHTGLIGAAGPAW